MKMKKFLLTSLFLLLGGAISLSAEIPLTTTIFFKGSKESQEKFMTTAGIKFLLDKKTEFIGATAEIEISQKNFLEKVEDLEPKISLKKAYLTLIPLISQYGTLGFQIGRYPAYEIFSSKVQFDSSLEGILAFWDMNQYDYGKPFIKSGAFLTNANFFNKDKALRNYNCILETGIQDIGKSGIYCIFSAQSWNIQKKRNMPLKYDFLIFEGMIGKKLLLQNDILCDGFIGFLINAKEKSKENVGFYIGTSLGNSEQKGKVSIKALYKIIYPKLLPLQDLQGISCRSNYHGPVINVKYRLTDNCLIEGKWETASRFKKEEKKFFIQNYEVKTRYIF